MRLLFTIFIIAVASAIAEWFAPWWIIAVVAVVAGFLSRLSTGKAFLAGFSGIALLWLVVALYRDLPNDHILSARMAQLFSLPSFGLFIAVIVLIGGIVGGLSAWSGAQIRRLTHTNRPKKLVYH